MKNEEAHREFEKFLRSAEHRITPERLEVLDHALEYGKHFSADDLYVVMKKENSKVSRATVYNSLELLVKYGVLIKRNFGKNKSLYESTYDRNNHGHLICKTCGNIVEFDISKVSKIVNEIVSDNHFTLDSFQFNISGQCQNHKN